MVKNIDNLWKCSICGLEYLNESLAGACERSHEHVLVMFKRTDLQNLVQFIYTRDEEFLNESLMSTILKYNKRMKGA